jgi:hypothetical protein
MSYYSTRGANMFYLLVACKSSVCYLIGSKLPKS